MATQKVIFCIISPKRFWQESWTRFLRGPNLWAMVGFSRHEQKTFHSLPANATQPFLTKTRTITKLKLNWVRREMSQTLGLGGVIPRFVNRSWLRNLTVRAMAFSSSSSDYGDQSRGGLPRFYSETLPPSKALSSSFFLLLSQLFRKHITLQFHMNSFDVVSIWNQF